MVQVASSLQAGSGLELVIELVFSSLKIKDRQVGSMRLVLSSDFFYGDADRALIRFIVTNFPLIKNN
jgi:hypothetical protein